MLHTVNKYSSLIITISILIIFFSSDAFAWRIKSDYSSQVDNYGNTLPPRGVVMTPYITGKIDVFQAQRYDDSKLVASVKLVEVSQGREVPCKSPGKLMIRYYEKEMPLGSIKAPDKTFTVKHGEDVEITVPDHVSLIYFTLRLKELPDKDLAQFELAR